MINIHEGDAGGSFSVRRALVRLLVVAAVPWDARFKEVNMIQYNSLICLMKLITGGMEGWGGVDDGTLTTTACVELH